MEQSEIRNRVCAIVGSITGHSTEALLENASFAALGLDSFELVTIEAAIENDFDIEFGNSTIAPTATLDDLVALVEVHTASGQQPSPLARTFSLT